MYPPYSLKGFDLDKERERRERTEAANVAKDNIGYRCQICYPAFYLTWRKMANIHRLLKLIPTMKPETRELYNRRFFHHEDETQELLFWGRRKRKTEELHTYFSGRMMLLRSHITTYIREEETFRVPFDHYFEVECSDSYEKYAFDVLYHYAKGEVRSKIELKSLGDLHHL